MGGFPDISLPQLGAIDQPKTYRDDPRREENGWGGGLSQKKPAVDGGENGAEQTHEREEGRCKAPQHQAVEVIANDV